MNSSFETMLGEAFTGKLTLKDGEAQDIQEKLDTIAGLIKTEVYTSEGELQYTYKFSTPDLIQSGPRLPGKRKAQFERYTEGNCEWLVQCEQQGPDWVEKNRRCIGKIGVQPPCPLNTTIVVNG